MKIKNVLFVAAVCVLAALTSCGGSKKAHSIIRRFILSGKRGK
jgi:hypothetical protein